MERNIEKDGTLIKSLIAVQGELMPILTNRQNTFTQAKYLDLSELLRTVKPILTAYEILLQQYVDITDENAAVTTMLMNEKGEYLTCGGSLKPTQMKGANSTQWLGASITYLRRFQALTILGLIGTEDDDESTFTETPTPGNAPPVELNGPTVDQVQQLMDAIKSIADEDVFSDHDRNNVKAAIANSHRSLPALQKVLADTQSAYTDKRGATE